MSPEERQTAHLETLFNTVMFFFIQSGECMYAVYTLILFSVCRHGPNAEFSSLSPDRVTDEGFNMITNFLVIIVISEFLVSWLAVRLLNKTSRNALDPRPYVGHWAKVHLYVGERASR